MQIIRSLDWWTILIYVALLTFGWVSVCGASYSFDSDSLFSLDSRSGMQIVWIGTSICLGFFILMMKDRSFDTFAYLVYGVLLVLLFLTIFNPHEIKGSKSWLVLGPLRIQPAEFAKFATALAISKVMSVYNFSIRHTRDFLIAAAVVMAPMLLIVMQKETGSALVYFSFFLMFYREGMPGFVLFTAFAAVFYFVVGIRYEDVALLGMPTSAGTFWVLLAIQLCVAGLLHVYLNDRQRTRLYLIIIAATTTVALLFSLFVIPFNIMWVQIALLVLATIDLLLCAFGRQIKEYLFIAAFLAGSALFFYSASYVLNNVMQPHQRVRINVLLGLEQDLAGAGYNVHQSEIAIGSGGLGGKGFLNGTQTKLKYVPEQDTDFIFCTVGEEEGFLGSASVLILFLALILRLIHVAERQTLKFGRIYGYCVVSIFLFHVFINVGMVLGLTPVIGIPLPFFSYGGSSLWGFTILLFIFLRIDAAREMKQA